ncbi:hypothetical protein PILCRDRAFT_122763 [Piloderma croceum F 1598]|uniref:DUF6534 domain-containing protein n=1 Tax=Piloderma croceum (strain F 1598) TaxID=765440 RepID=A0A0C3G872_PILCF|nr:hypothetical protein PILCRDRAFT_122763 [Piloderma croceum F 1598]
MIFLKLYPENFDGDKTVIARDSGPLVNETAGPFFVGFTISAALFGVTCAQGGLYFKRHSRDSTRLRCIVIALLCLETFHAALVTHAIYSYTITDRGSLSDLNGTVWSISIQVVPATVIVALVQYVWIIRIGTISQSHRAAQFAIAMLSLVVIEMVMTLAWMVATLTISSRWGSTKGVLRTTEASFVLRVFNDTLITGLLCYHLQRSKNGLRGSDSTIQKMIEYGLRAGVLNWICSVVLMVLLVTMPTKPYYVGIYIVSCRLHANSLLAMLNFRMPQKATEQTGSNVSDLGEVELSSAHWGLSMSPSITRLTISEL